MANRQRKFRSIDGTAAWARAQGIKNCVEWSARTQAPDFPDDIPTNPRQVYPDFAQRGGMPGLLGLTSWNGVSKIEMVLKHALQRVLDLDQSLMTSIHDGGKVMHVDMADRGRRIIVEYDGFRWHNDPKAIMKDRQRTQRLNRAGWTVVRVRETPLELLDPVLDVGVRAREWKYSHIIEVVMRHIEALISSGKLGDDDLARKIGMALESPIGETELHTILTVGRRSYEDASAWAHTQGIKTGAAWFQRTKEPDFPRDIPKNPYVAYLDFSERGGMGAFLGTGKVANYHRAFRPFHGGAAWAQQQGIKTATGWTTRAKQPGFPNDIPKRPHLTYPDFYKLGGWDVFCGRTKYEIRLAKTGEDSVQLTSSNDPTFVMAWAA
ncbi:endonuclease domain-containing protein [Burkholderia glumae]|uniref:endonuclease domain-containing protein n=1 Tax=Burkholderia glumae TaxID=337 RepID=UPI002151088B|nr:DUF559 domain-containing protein [Burkholderia glumae]